MSGDVVIRVAGAQPAALTTGATLPPGGILSTGAGSRAMLVRDEEQIIVGPNATIAIPPGSNDSEFTRILQTAGVVEFTVEKQNVMHFAVVTPMLAAVVKGTHFSVGAFSTTGAVKVASGRVQVTALASGQMTDVLGGQLVEIRSGGGMSLSGQGPFSDVLQGPAPGESGDPGQGGEAGILVNLEVSGDGVAAGVGGLLDVGAGPGGLRVGVGDLMDVEAGAGGLTAEVGGVVDLGLGGDGLSAEVGDLLDVDAGGDGVSVEVGGLLDVDVGGEGGGLDLDIGGLHLGLFGR
jgi:hypothetical protein